MCGKPWTEKKPERELGGRPDGFDAEFVDQLASRLAAATKPRYKARLVLETSLIFVMRMRLSTALHMS